MNLLVFLGLTAFQRIDVDKAVQNEFSIYFVVGVLLLASIVIYKMYLYSVTVKTEGRDRNYYYNRFMRNKEQVERYMESLQHSITLFNCGDERFGEDSKTTAQQHLIKLQSDYNADYTEVTQKILKKNKLTRRDKKMYIKLLSNQSEKLYNIEKIVREINNKYKV
ncbi:hypothetical protein [Flavobacterium tegetincola]|uniref:hypothetical protein n=1 Tax=Flavobacterium tegetincola TaxID=150172 RepID=UPI0003F6A3B5|nr:hypothetical protein [Flavobacterium tegetincola]